MPLRKVQALRYKGIICDKCGVESHVEGSPERMATSARLAVSHVWYFKASRAHGPSSTCPRALEKSFTSPNTSYDVHEEVRQRHARGPNMEKDERPIVCAPTSTPRGKELRAENEGKTKKLRRGRDGGRAP